jgi:hypothetical protein
MRVALALALVPMQGRSCVHGGPGGDHASRAEDHVGAGYSGMPATFPDVPELRSRASTHRWSGAHLGDAPGVRRRVAA